MFGVATAHGGAVAQVRLASSINPAPTTSTTFVNVPSATATITVPHGTRALIVAHFSATSECTDSVNTTGAYSCMLRILIGGVEANPTDTNAQIFDSSAQDGREAHAVERFRGPLGPGTYNVVVQFKVPAATNTFWLDSWTLEVDRIKA